jgi:transposase, IS30 family
MATHLKAEERAVLAQRVAAGISKAAIARELRRDRRTIDRELRRNSIAGIYCPAQAQKLSERRRCQGRAKCRKMARPENLAYVKEGLQKYWSPDQIAGRSRRDFPQDRRRQFSRQLVYNWLKSNEHRRPLLAFLRRGGKKRRQRRPQPHAGPQGVANRPEIVNTRGRDGDWEGDTIIGPGSAVLANMTERRSGFLVLLPVPSRTAQAVRQALCGRLTQFPAPLRLTATFDNGREFLETKALESALGLEVFYTRPSSPWQRGSIENLNGLIRQFFPKGTNFQPQSRYRIAQVEQLLNNRPRKRLNYQTPSEIFQQQCQRAIQT